VAVGTVAGADPGGGGAAAIGVEETGGEVRGAMTGGLAGVETGASGVGGAALRRKKLNMKGPRQAAVGNE
jgi:hypothetical protein